MRWYSFDPFTRMKKDEATVAALRRRAAGHDVSVMARSTRARTADEKLEGFRRRARQAVAASRNRMHAQGRRRTSKARRRGRLQHSSGRRQPGADST